jgi:cleavage and polyadenylation specificity factor subunit 2
MIKSSVSKGGIVLIPTDASARVLELAYLLEHSWRAENKEDDSPLKTAKLYLASGHIGSTMRHARLMIEWMDDGVIREFEAMGAEKKKKQNKSKDDDDDQGSSGGPFTFKHLKLLQRKTQIDKILNETDNLGRSIGKVILASDTSMEWGFSKEVLRKISDDRRNLVILTEKLTYSAEDRATCGIARTLWSWWEEKRDGIAPEETPKGDKLEQVYSGGREVELRDARRVPLEGNDLAVYQQWLATQRQLQITLQNGGATALESSADVVDDASSDSSSDSEESDTDQQGKALNISATMGQANRKKIGLSDEDLGVNILLRKKGVYDYDVRGKKGREKMFPIAIRRKRIDDFGELIRPEDFLRAEERDEIDGQDMRPEVQPGKYDTKDTLGKKRKWDDIAASADRMIQNSGNKRQQMGKGNSGNPADSEDDTEDFGPVEEVVGPSRVVFSTEVLSINLRLAFVDFAGLHDKRSLQMLIPLIQPRKLILVSGMKEETLALASDCRKLLAAQMGSSDESVVNVYTPEVGVTVNASVDTNAWVVKLTDSLVKRLRWQHVKGLGIVTLTGKLEAPSIEAQPNEVTSHKKQKMTKGGAEATITQAALASAPIDAALPLLDILPSSMASAARSIAQPLHVGDLRLADLRKIMQSSGHTAEFRGEGTLLIDGSVIVRKTGTGRIEVESIGLSAGAASATQQGSTFYAVKSKIYEGLAIVTGG